MHKVRRVKPVWDEGTPVKQSLRESHGCILVIALQVRLVSALGTRCRAILWGPTHTISVVADD